MSIYDLKQLSKQELILHYLLEHKMKGGMLQAKEYLLIDNWLNDAGGDANLVLAALAAVFRKLEEKNIRPTSFAKLDRVIMKQIKHRLPCGDSNRI